MSLTRWSNSIWYIYETSSDEVKVEGLGQFSVTEIISNYEVINRRALEDGYTFLERLELEAYLEVYSRLKVEKISFHQANLFLKILRNLGLLKMYLQNAYSFEGLLPPFEKLRERKRMSTSELARLRADLSKRKTRNTPSS